jgi:hypothetical protein
MAPLISIQTPTVADLDVIQNRVAVALAARERLVKSWTALSSRPCPPLKTQEELDAEDAELFHFEPPHLGLGASIPKAYLEGDAQRREISSNEKLKHLILGNKSGHQGSKLRDSQEKASSIKRNLKDDSSDDDEGRSGLGKAKKFKTGNSSGQSGFLVSLSGSSGPAVNIRTRPEPSQSAPSSNLPTKQGTIPKKPLVDYRSDDDCDDDDVSAAAPAVPVAPTRKLSSIAQSKAPPVSNLSSPKEVRSKNIIDQTKAVITKPPSKAASINGSSKESSRASSSDSEPSDLEIAIPLALDADVTKMDSVAADDAKRVRNRQKRARKKERQLRQKALTLASGSMVKPLVASVGGPVIAKKLKDRLLDANGN